MITEYPFEKVLLFNCVCHRYLCVYTPVNMFLSHCQNVQADSFLTNPIIFGDFMKVGADKSDRQYEELTNIEKVQQALGDVSTN